MGAGRVPYRQFEFAYGPLFLYLPLGLMRAFHLFLPDSYLLAWLAEWIAGVFVLWGTVQVAASLSPHRNSIFIVLFATSIPVVVTLGENYTALRLFALPGAAMATWTVWQRSCSARLSALTALVAMAGLLAISPELAVAFALATGTFLLIGLAAAKDRWPALCIFILGSLLLLAMAAWEGVFLTLLSFSSGGNNVPLLPSPGILFMLGLVLAAGCLGFSAFRQGSFGGPLPYLVLTSLFCLPSGFGRCDGGHLYQSTSGAILVAFTAFSFEARAWRWSSRLFLLFTLLPLPIALYQSNSLLSVPVAMKLAGSASGSPLRKWSTRAMSAVFGQQVAERKINKVIAALPHLQPTPDGNAIRRVYAPFGYSSYLHATPGLPVIDTGLYDGFTNLTTVQQVDAKIADLNAAGDLPLLLPEAIQCSYAVDRRQTYLNTVALYVPKPRNTIHILEPICEYVRARYTVTGETAPITGMVIARRNHTLR